MWGLGTIIGRNRKIAEEYNRNTSPRSQFDERLTVFGYTNSERESCLRAYDSFIRSEDAEKWANRSLSVGARLVSARQIIAFYWACQGAKEQTKLAPKTFPERVREELETARENYEPFNSHHEGWAILQEEVEELWEEVKKKPSKRDPQKILSECVQVSAMAQRMAEDMGLCLTN